MVLLDFDKFLIIVTLQWDWLFTCIGNLIYSIQLAYRWSYGVLWLEEVDPGEATSIATFLFLSNTNLSIPSTNRPDRLHLSIVNSNLYLAIPIDDIKTLEMRVVELLPGDDASSTYVRWTRLICTSTRFYTPEETRSHAISSLLTGSCWTFGYFLNSTERMKNQRQVSSGSTLCVWTSPKLVKEIIKWFWLKICS